MLFEHVGDNRSGKTFLMAMWAFFDWLRGVKVYANCRTDSKFPGGYDCFINYPHYHYDPEFGMPYEPDTTVITDESLRTLESRRAGKEAILEKGYWAREATKAGQDWHWDAFDHTEIEKRVRRSWHYQIKTTRIPHDPDEPLAAIRVEARSRYSAKWRKGYFPNPDWNLPVSFFFPVYNDKATLRRRQLEATVE